MINNVIKNIKKNIF